MISAQEAKKLSPLLAYKRLIQAFDEQVHQAAYSGKTFVLLTDVYHAAGIRLTTNCDMHNRLIREIKDAGYALEGQLIICWRNA